MGLQQKLDAFKAEFLRTARAGRPALYETKIEELRASFALDRAIRTGEQAPEFTLPDALTGKPVSSTDLLALGPLVIKFFRGRWCPYCVTELEIWRDLHAEVRGTGAFLIAISPQTRRHNDFTLQQHYLPFPILSDTDAKVADQFGIAYSVPQAHRDYYKGILVNIPFVNSGNMYKSATEASWRLPLPAIFVVGQDGTIAFSEGHADFRVRPEPADVLEGVVSAVKR